VLSYTDRRRLALRAALDLLQSPPRASELRGLQRGLDTWAGVGLVTKGAQRQGCDLQLNADSDRHWRATFFVAGIAHSIVGGSAWEPTPWRAVQRAGWAASLRLASTKQGSRSTRMRREDGETDQ
jgi:hypothetical protein